MAVFRHFLVVGVFLGLAATPAASQTKLLRFPDVHEERVVFVYAGDLWTAVTDGGTATRLTAHPGLEVFPKFSPITLKVSTHTPKFFIILEIEAF